MSDKCTGFYTDEAGEWRWRLVARNGRIVGASSEGYKNRVDCVENLYLCERIARVLRISENGHKEAEDAVIDVFNKGPSASGFADWRLLLVVGVAWMVALLAGCVSPKKNAGIPGDQAVLTGRYFDPVTGKLVSEASSYEGQVLAGKGGLRDNSASAGILALAGKVDGTQFSYGRIARSYRQLANIQNIQKIETEHKGALEKLAGAAAGGPAAYAAAAEEVARLGQKLVEAHQAMNEDPPGDDSSTIAEFLSSGEGHAEAIRGAGESFTKALMASYQRAGVSLDSYTADKDITSTEDLGLALEAFRAYHAAEVEKAKLKAEIEKLRVNQEKPAPGVNTPSAPTVPGGADLSKVPSGERPDGTNPDEWDRLLYGERNPVWGGNEPGLFVQADQTRVKEKSDDGVWVWLTPNKFDRQAKLELVKDGSVVETARYWSRSNGYRPTWKFKQVGGAYSFPITGRLTSVNGVVREYTVTGPDHGNKDVEWKVISPAREPSLPEVDSSPSTGGVVDVDPGAGIATLTPALEQHQKRVKWVYADDDWDGRPYLDLVKSKRGWVREDGEGRFPVEGNSGLFLNTAVASVRPPSPFGDSIQRVFFEASPEWDNIFYQVAK